MDIARKRAPWVGLSTWALAGLVVWTAACSGGGDSTASGSGYPAGVEVLDADGNSLGSIAFSTTCSPEADALMKRGLSLVHHMTFTQGEAVFRQAADVDPTCALAYWGIALSYVHPLWPDVPPDEAFATGWELLQKARDVGTADARELAYVAALEAYYRDGLSRSEPERLASYAEGWAQANARYPQDPEAALFRALSLLATASDADKTYATRVQAGAIAEGVLAAIPDHPGAHHYVIHAYDVPTLAARGLSAARNYGAVAPDNAHALHMTSHIFTRVGSWQESIDFNARSAAAALRQPIGGAVSHHYLHALDYLAYAHLQRGEPARALQVLDDLKAIDGPVVPNGASAYAFAAVPARIALEQREWADAVSTPVRWPSTLPWDAFPHLEAIGHFARALGAAHTGDLVAAKRAATRLGELRQAAAGLPDAYDWATQVEIQEIGARAWIAYAGGETDEALRLMSRAAELEATTEKNPVTPSEVLPAGELLGDMLADLERYQDALAAYQTALDRSPNRLNSLFGAGRAAELAGDAATARTYYGQVLELLAESAAPNPRLEHARAFVEAQ